MYVCDFQIQLPNIYLSVLTFYVRLCGKIIILPQEFVSNIYQYMYLGMNISVLFRSLKHLEAYFALYFNTLFTCVSDCIIHKLF